MYDDRTNLTRQVETDLRGFFEKSVFETVIPRSIRLAEAPATESRSSLTMFAREAPRAIFNWQRRFWLVNITPDKQRKAWVGTLRSSPKDRSRPQFSQLQSTRDTGSAVASIPIAKSNPIPCSPARYSMPRDWKSSLTP